MQQSPPFLSHAEHIMDPDPVIVYADEPVSVIAALSADLDHVAVVDDMGAFCGVISPGAVIIDSLATAGSLAEKPAVSATLGEPAFDVVSRMLARRVDWVPVIDDGRLRGVITRRCVKAAYGELSAR